MLKSILVFTVLAVLASIILVVMPFMSFHHLIGRPADESILWTGAWFALLLSIVLQIGNKEEQ